MRAWTDSTLMSMKKSDLIERLRCAEHDKAVAEGQLAQHIENVKEWVPVVRCKDCEHLVNTTINANGFLICDISDMEIAPDDFCSYGERREE